MVPAEVGELSRARASVVDELHRVRAHALVHFRNGVGPLRAGLADPQLFIHVGVRHGAKYACSPSQNGHVGGAFALPRNYVLVHV